MQSEPNRTKPNQNHREWHNAAFALLEFALLELLSLARHEIRADFWLPYCEVNYSCNIPEHRVFCQGSVNDYGCADTTPETLLQATDRGRNPFLQCDVPYWCRNPMGCDAMRWSGFCDGLRCDRCIRVIRNHPATTTNSRLHSVSHSLAHSLDGAVVVHHLVSVFVLFVVVFVWSLGRATRRIPPIPVRRRHYRRRHYLRCRRWCGGGGGGRCHHRSDRGNGERLQPGTGCFGQGFFLLSLLGDLPLVADRPAAGNLEARPRRGLVDGRQLVGAAGGGPSVRTVRRRREPPLVAGGGPLPAPQKRGQRQKLALLGARHAGQFLLAVVVLFLRVEDGPPAVGNVSVADPSDVLGAVLAAPGAVDGERRRVGR
mmetsp:Transcript_4030/g.11558  ORF Transcript_4030/g.11558 Transcript_4030/m.11558 type:complete len:371 (+) Transcript_4030:14-1126(+)